MDFKLGFTVLRFFQKLSSSYLLIMFSLAFLSACGGSDSPSTNEISGFVIDGPISNSSVTLHRINADGSVGDQVAGAFITDANGEWTGSAPSGNTDVLVVVATGGQYTDDATGNTVVLADNDTMNSWYDPLEPAKNRVVSPITDTLWQVVKMEISQGKPLRDSVAVAEQVANDFWGIDPTDIVPDQSSNNAAEQRYGVLLAGFSFLMNNHALLQVSPFVGMERFTLMRLLMDDMADGRFDGNDLEGTPIFSEDGTRLPALSPNDLSAFFKEANDYAAILQLDPVEDNPNRGLNVGYNIVCPTNGILIYNNESSGSTPHNIDTDNIKIVSNQSSNSETNETIYLDTYTIPFTNATTELKFSVSATQSKGSSLTNWIMNLGGGAQYGATGTFEAELAYKVGGTIMFKRGTPFGLYPANGGDAVPYFICGSFDAGVGTTNFLPSGPNHHDQYYVGGNVNGLNSNSMVVLQNNATDDEAISSNGKFWFSNIHDDNDFFNISILTQPTGQTCTLSNSAGQISGAHALSTGLSCEDNPLPTYSIGGSVSGLGLNNTVILQNNLTDELSVSSNGSFVFNSELLQGADYNVSILSSPVSQTCQVTEGATGTLAQSDINDVVVVCIDKPSFTLGGTVSGLSGNLLLNNSNGDSVQINSNGAYSFANDVYQGDDYAVTIGSSPITQSCVPSNAMGTISDSDVSNINIDCSSSSLLSGMSISSGSLLPTFTAEHINYSLTLDENVTSMTLTPTAIDQNASITVNGSPVVSGSSSQTINLNLGNNTVLINVVAADTNSTTQYEIAVARGNVINITQIFFPGDDGTTGYELWKTDGTSNGTVLVKEINPSTAGSISTSTWGWGLNTKYKSQIQLGDFFYFSADDGQNGEELWKTDGTSNGTVMVKDINTTSQGAASNPGGFIAVGSTIFFSANNGINGFELWKTDGTESGTVLVKDLRPGSGSGFSKSYADRTISYNGLLLFTYYDLNYGIELWKSDGTANGTVLVKDIYTGNSSNLKYLTLFNNKVYFQATTAAGAELWSSDGTTANTQMVVDLYNAQYGASPSFLTVYNNLLYFSARGGNLTTRNNYELWQSDGTAQGTVLLKEINPFSDAFGKVGSYPNKLTVANNLLFFSANADVPTANSVSPNVELWKSDGTANGTVKVKDINPSGSSHPKDFIAVGSDVFFRISDVNAEWKFWKSDGTSSGTAKIKDINATGVEFLDHLGIANDTLYFSVNDGIVDTELWQSDGSDSGTSIVKDLNPSGHGVPENM